MKDGFKELKMYQCVYCGKVFRTNNRHKCKFDPEHTRNCFSCQFFDYIEIKEEGSEIEGESMKNKTENTNKCIVCKLGEKVSLLNLSKQKYFMNCQHWICTEGYEGKETFVRAAFSKNPSLGFTGNQLIQTIEDELDENEYNIGLIDEPLLEEELPFN